MAKKSQKTLAKKQINKFWKAVLIWTITVVSAVVISSVVVSVYVSDYNGKQIRSLEARTERLEFCVAKQISPCSYEKLAEWNTNHPEPSDQFRPRVDDGFYSTYVR